MESRLTDMGAAIEAMPDPFFVFDEADRLKALNSAAIEFAAGLTAGSLEEILRAILGLDATDSDYDVIYQSYHVPSSGFARAAINGSLFDFRAQRSGNGKALMFRRVGKADAGQKDADEKILKQGRVSFLNSMSHDLRTPLNSIIGFAEIIAMKALGNDVGPRYQGYAADIVTEANRLHEAIDALITLASLESNDMELRLETTDTAQLLRDSVGAISTSHPDVSIDCETPPLRLLVKLDKSLMHQALTAVMAEVIHYSQLKGVKHLKATVKPKTNAVAFSFSVNAEIDHLRTRQEEASTGLWIGHTIASAHGGGLRLWTDQDGRNFVRLVLPTA